MVIFLFEGELVPAFVHNNDGVQSSLQVISESPYIFLPQCKLLGLFFRCEAHCFGLAGQLVYSLYL